MKLTRRGQIVFGISLGVAIVVALLGLTWITDHINWVGDHYCFRSSLQCYGLDK